MNPWQRLQKTVRQVREIQRLQALLKQLRAFQDLEKKRAALAAMLRSEKNLFLAPEGDQERERFREECDYSREEWRALLRALRDTPPDSG